MASAQLIFFLSCLFMGEIAQSTNLKNSLTVRQERRFVSVKIGDNLTLRCFYENDIATRYHWYKQSVGEKPKRISTFYKYNKNGSVNEFDNNPRFALDTEIGNNHLTIRDIRISDAATYYCASSYSHNFKFGEGSIVSVEDSVLNIHQSVSETIHQSVSEIIQPGGSVTLNCTVQTGTCDGGHSVYWFKDSKESHPGLIYTHGDRNDQCERKSDTQIHICVYNLHIMSLNRSHAGTYYCAVASCGHILFGNRTKLDFEDELNSLVLVYILSGALVFTTILTVSLAFFMCAITKKNSCTFAESHTRSSGPSTVNTEGEQNEANIHYAALEEHRVNRTRRERNNTKSECVYSSVKVQN